MGSRRQPIDRSPKIRLVIVDDHQLFRDGLRALLATERDLQVVGCAGDAREACRVVEAHRPDLVLLDLGLPGTSGLAVLRDLRRGLPRVRVLVLTMHASPEFVRQALALGAAGYALKDQPPSELVQAIRGVVVGERYLAPCLPRSLLEAPVERAAEGPLGALSAREREIFDLAARGFPNSAIAATLCISVKTVETHRAHINRKLGVHNVAQLIRFAARNGLVSG